MECNEPPSMLLSSYGKAVRDLGVQLMNFRPIPTHIALFLSSSRVIKPFPCHTEQSGLRAICQCSQEPLRKRFAAFSLLQSSSSPSARMLGMVSRPLLLSEILNVHERQRNPHAFFYYEFTVIALVLFVFYPQGSRPSSFL